MNFDEEEDDDDEVSSSSSQLNSNTRPGSATSKKSSKVGSDSVCLLSPSFYACRTCHYAFVTLSPLNTHTQTDTHTAQHLRALGTGKLETKAFSLQ